MANVCNQSLMKLVTPEDDEPDEPRPVVQKQAGPNPEDCTAKQEGAASGEWALPPASTSQAVHELKGRASPECSRVNAPRSLLTSRYSRAHRLFPVSSQG